MSAPPDIAALLEELDLAMVEVDARRDVIAMAQRDLADAAGRYDAAKDRVEKADRAIRHYLRTRRTKSTEGT